MADTSVGIKDAASTTVPIDTFTQSNGDHRQAMVLGDATAAATATIDAAGRLSVIRPNSYTTGTITAANANLISGAATAGSAVQVTVPDGHSSWTVFITGTWTAGTTLHFQGSPDGNTWHALNGRLSGTVTTNDTMTQLFTDPVGGTVPSNFRGNVSAVRFYRVTAGPFATGDSVGVQIVTSAAPGATFQNAALPSGGNVIGAVRNVSAATSAITSVAAATVSTTILAANTARLGATVFNDSTALLYLGLTAAAVSATAHTVQVPAGGYFELPSGSLSYTGQLTGLWSAAVGAARVTELRE